MQIADGEDKIFPVRIIDFFKELLVNHSGECLIKTGFKTLWRFVGDLDDFLKQTQRELAVRLTSDPQSEFFMRLLIFRVAPSDNHLLNLLHEFET